MPREVSIGPEDIGLDLGLRNRTIEFGLVEVGVVAAAAATSSGCVCKAGSVVALVVLGDEWGRFWDFDCGD